MLSILKLWGPSYTYLQAGPKLVGNPLTRFKILKYRDSVIHSRHMLIILEPCSVREQTEQVWKQSRSALHLRTPRCLPDVGFPGRCHRKKGVPDRVLSALRRRVLYLFTGMEKSADSSRLEARTTWHLFLRMSLRYLSSLPNNSPTLLFIIDSC